MIGYIFKKSTGEFSHTLESTNEAMLTLQESESQAVFVSETPLINYYLDLKSGVVKEKPHKPSEHCVFDHRSLSWFDPRTVEEVRVNKLKEMKLSRDTSESAGFEFMGMMIDSDEKSVTRIQAAVLSSGETIDWVTQDNNVLTLDQGALLALKKALSDHISSQHSKYKAIKETANSSKIPEIDTITW